MNTFPFSAGVLDYAECRRVVEWAVKRGLAKHGAPSMTDSQRRYFLQQLREGKIT